MDAVVKVGGSLAVNATILRELCAELGKDSERFRLVLVPGGGEFADVIRILDARFGLSANVAHRMAVLGMDQYGLLLADLIPRCRVAFSLKVVPSLSGVDRITVLSPSRMVFRARSLKASWDVTSDSIAAYVAGRLGVDKLILITDVDGIFTANPKVDAGAQLIREVSASGLIQLGKQTSVDQFLPNMLLKYELDCFVVNGSFPERITHLLAGEDAISTHITPK